MDRQTSKFRPLQAFVIRGGCWESKDPDEDTLVRLETEGFLGSVIWRVRPETEKDLKM